MSLFVVYLRRPATLSDQRWDPFWEFGSFGSTGCHRGNLLSKNCRVRPGDSVVFLQGGDACIRAVALAEIRDVRVLAGAVGKDGAPGEKRELRWTSIVGPFAFENAPLMIDNDGGTDFKTFRAEKIDGSLRMSLVGGAASRLRALANPLSASVEKEVRSVFAKHKRPIARAFHEIIPDGAWRRQREGSIDADRRSREAAYAENTGSPPRPRGGCR